MNAEILSSNVVSEGTWTQVDGLKTPFSVSLHRFAVGDAVQIYVSNLYDKPPAVAPVAGDGTFQLGDDYSSDILVEITINVRWLRVRKSVAGASPAITKAEIQGLYFPR